MMTNPSSSSSSSLDDDDDDREGGRGGGDTSHRLSLGLLPVALRVSVFVSDFSAAKTRASLEWALFGLYPLPAHLFGFRVELDTTSVSSAGVDWGSEETYEQRIRQEVKTTIDLALCMRLEANKQASNVYEK